MRLYVKRQNANSLDFFISGLDCAIELHRSKRIVLPENVTLSETLAEPLAELQCLYRCKVTLSPNGQHCWAISVNKPIVTYSMCYLHIGPMATILDETFLKDDSSFNVRIWECYKGKILLIVKDYTIHSIIFILLLYI